MSNHEPHADRPNMPEGYGVPEDNDGLLTWGSVRERLEQAKNFWICTASMKNKPHARPLWAAWVDDTLYFDGALTTGWGRNLSVNPQVEVHLESGSEVVIIEGEFTVSNNLTPEAFARVQQSYKQRYEEYTPAAADGLYMIRPRKVLAWTSFPKDVTRFVFKNE